MLNIILSLIVFIKFTYGDSESDVKFVWVNKTLQLCGYVLFQDFSIALKTEYQNKIVFKFKLICIFRMVLHLI